MKTVLFALALALAMPIGAQTLDYATLCGDATEGTGDNNDFCHLWAQGNHQGMRHALSIAIRTARAAENRNRFYFDHKRGSERGEFIQLKRPWMGTDWRVLQNFDWSYETKTIRIRLYNDNRGHKVRVHWDFAAQGFGDQNVGGEFGYQELSIVAVLENDVIFDYTDSLYAYDAHLLRQLVECRLDEFGWQIGAVQTQPDCQAVLRNADVQQDVVDVDYRFVAFWRFHEGDCFTCDFPAYGHEYGRTAALAESNAGDECREGYESRHCRVVATLPTANVGKPYCWALARYGYYGSYGVGEYNNLSDRTFRHRAEEAAVDAAVEACNEAQGETDGCWVALSECVDATNWETSGSADSEGVASYRMDAATGQQP